MTAVAFNHFNLRAPRPLLDALRDFYSDVVGLQPGPRPSFRSFGYWLYLGDQPILHLSEAGPEEQRTTGVATAFDHVAFTCVERAAMEDKLKRMGVAYEMAHVPGTQQVQLFLTDPAGNGVELNFSEC